MIAKKLRHLGIVGLALLGVGLIPSISRATLTPYYSGGDFQNATSSTSNILFNQDLTTTGTTVEGSTNASGSGTDAGVILTFTSLDTPSVTLTVGSNGGQAKISAQSGATFNTLAIAPVSTPDPPNTGSLYALSFNAATLNQTGTLSYTVYATDQYGNPESAQTFQTANSNGQNFFGVVATDGERITKVTITANMATGGLVAINNVGEFKIAPGADPTVVPEPSTVGLALSGLGTIGLVGLRRLRRKPGV